MEDNKPENSTKNLIDSAKSIVVILPPDPSEDLVAAGVSLHLALKASGKLSQIGCGSAVHVSDQIEGVAEITDTIGSRNLIISFDYREEDLDKVDYDVRDDGKFYLLVKPKEGSPVPDIGGVKYSYSGANADLVIILGANSLEELGKIYADEKNFLDHVNTVSLNISLHPSSFTGNLFHRNMVSFSELVAVFIESYALKTSPLIAQNLLNNIFESTGNLADTRLKADTFASIAFLMRAGAKLPTRQVRPVNFTEPPFFEVPSDQAAENQTVDQEGVPLPEEEFLSADQADLPVDEAGAPVPPDWNKPKIFRVGDKKDAS